jgi:hypothetical protein
MLDPDVQAYIIQASDIIAKEQQFIPSSEEDTQQWLAANLPAIALKASELQREILDKIQDDNVREKVSGILAAQVWGDVRRSEITQTEEKHYRQILET